MEKNGYNLSRQWFDFSFENPDKVNCSHTALYIYIIDKRNRFGQKDKFGLPALYTMEALNIKSKNTYYKIFNELSEFGFIKIVQKSTNQNTSNVISLPFAISKNKSALDTALIQQGCHRDDSTVVSGGNIDKQINKETKEQINKLLEENKNLKIENKKLKDKLKKEKDKKKNNTLSTKGAKPAYGDPEINSCLEIIKSVNDGICDGTQSEQRRYAKHLINKIKKTNSVSSGKFTRNEYLQGIVLVVSGNKYHSSKISGPRKIYDNLGALQMIANKEYKEKEKSSKKDFIYGFK